MDHVFVEGLTLRARCGVTEHERQVGCTLVIDMEAETDSRSAGASDDIDTAVDYAHLTSVAADTVSGAEFRLVEAVAEQIAAGILARGQVNAVRVRVAKRNPPMAHDVRFAGIVIERRR